jgi:phosphoglucomutase
MRDGLGVLNIESADGFVITPSHNPPEDGSFKYIPPYRTYLPTADHTFVNERMAKKHGMTVRGKMVKNRENTDCAGCHNPAELKGIHRLNRAEYANTIRDLLALDVELVSRLSFFLWSTMPDETLALWGVAVNNNRPESSSCS